MRRLERHRAIAKNLLEGPDQVTLNLMSMARATVALWRAERICSLDYIEQWDAVLAKCPTELAAVITTVDPYWDAMRQCSPFPSLGRSSSNDEVVCPGTA